jgi:hypothetical protein
MPPKMNIFEIKMLNWLFCYFPELVQSRYADWLAKMFQLREVTVVI